MLLTSVDKKKIQDEYVTPFIAEVQKLFSEPERVKDVIDETMRYFQIHAISNKVSGVCEIGFLDNIEAARMPVDFHSLLLKNKSFRESYVRLGRLFLYVNEIAQQFPEVSKEHLETVIREMLFNFLSPVKQLKILDEIDTREILDNRIQRQTDQLTALPEELKQHIISYLDDDSIIAFKRTSKDGYFSQKKMQDKKENIFYVVSVPIRYEKESIIALPYIRYVPRKDISKDEIKKSFTGAGQTQVKLFSSQYEALEYAISKRKGLDWDYFDDELGHIPAIFTVVYGGNAGMLQFGSEELTINGGTSSSVYGYTARKSVVSYATVKKSIVQPLSAAVVVNYSDFSDYRCYTEVSFKNENSKALLAKDKYKFLDEIQKYAELKTTKRVDILDLFNKLKDRNGQYRFLHKPDHERLSQFLVFFKSNVNGADEKNFWHTASYQKAVKILKTAYLAKTDLVLDNRQADEKVFIDYFRGNAVVHIGRTATRRLFR